MTADVQIIGGHAARSIQGIDQVRLNDVAPLSLKSHVISGGETSFYERDHVFGEIRAYKIDEAEILPSYRATVASAEYPLTDTFHVPPIHWHRYTPSLMAMNEGRALILRETAAHLEIEDAIYFGHNANYYHFICEDLPRLLLFEEQNGLRDRPVLVDLNMSSWQHSLLVRSGVDPSRWKAVNFRVPLRLPQLNVPSLVSRDFLVHPKAAELIRARLALAAGNMVSRKRKRLYLSRGAGGSRNARCLNEAVIARTTKSSCSPMPRLWLVLVELRLPILSSRRARVLRWCWQRIPTQERHFAALLRRSGKTILYVSRTVILDLILPGSTLVSIFRSTKKTSPWRLNGF